MKNLLTQDNFEQPLLETSRLTLEPIVESHAEEICELFSDPKLHEFVPQEPISLETAEARCTRWAKRKSPDGKELWLNWAAREKATSRIVAHFQAGLKDDAIATIGYMVARASHNKGIATEGLRAIIDYLKYNLEVIEARAWVDSRNIASHRLAAKLGMVQVELIKDADFFKGATSDEFVFSRKFEAYELQRVDLTSVALVQSILEAAPQYLLNVDGVTSNPNDGHDTLTALPPGCSLDQKHVLVLRLNGAAVGVADVIQGYPDPTTAFIGLMLLREDRQKGGSGRMFYQKIEEKIRRELDCNRIRLSVVDSNPVIPFWEKMGFTLTGESSPHQGKTIVSTKRIMEKRLS